MKIVELYKADSPVFSIEVLPPRNGADEHQMFEVINEAIPFNLGFVSITMGCDLSLRGGGLALAFLIKSRMNIEVLVHCTCVRRSREEIENILTECRYLGLENILALRGDPPRGEGGFIPYPEGYTYAYQIVQQASQINHGMYITRPTDRDYDNAHDNISYRKGIPTQFCIGVAGHPDGHPDCPSYEENFIYLKKKQDAGAEFIITQAFYDIEIFKRFIEQAKEYGIIIPIIPGIMPILNSRNLRLVQELFKVSIPKRYRSLYEKNRNKPDELSKIGMEHAISLCRDLLKLKVKGIQFFTLNRKGVLLNLLSNILS